MTDLMVLFPDPLGPQTCATVEPENSRKENFLTRLHGNRRLNLLHKTLVAIGKNFVNGSVFGFKHTATGCQRVRISHIHSRTR